MRRTNVLLLILLLATSTRAQLWEELADIPEDLTFPVVAVVNNYIHVMGGGATAGATDAHYRYNTATDTWDTMAPVPYLAQQPAGAAVNGKIHHFGGGFPNSGSPVDDHYIYDPGSDSWSQGGDLSAPRAIHYGINLNDTLYSIAGQGMKTLFEKYNPADSSWTARATLPDANFWYGAHATHGGKIYRFGGGGFTAPVSSAHIYDPATDQWTSISNLPTGSHAINGAPIGDSIYLVGGYNGGGTKDVWIYDIAMDTYVAGPELPVKRYYHRLMNIGSCIYAVGGTSGNPLDSLGTSLQRYCLGNMPSGGLSANSQSEVTWRTRAGSIEIELPGAMQEIQVVLYDVLGRSVYNRTTSGPSVSIPTANLPKAIYVVELRNATQSFTGKIVVQ